MQFEENKPLDRVNTFGLSAKTKLFKSVKTIDELEVCLKSKEAQNNNLFILGGGSNILLTNDFDGLTIKIDIKGIEVVEETNQAVLVKIGAGENWHEFVLYAINHNWGGVENLSLIPGTCGAAPMQNIGAYGIEIKEVFEKLITLDRQTGEQHIFDKEACNFGYRESIFKNTARDKFVIAEVYLRLTKDDHHINTSYGAIKDTLADMGVKSPTIRDVSNAVIHIRQSKLPDPAKIGNAGSFFKNPTIKKIDFDGLRTEFPDIPGYELPQNQMKVPAAWLIEQCGWKGLTRDAIGVHKNQALVLVNYGGGDGNDIKELALEIKESVARKFGIELNPEVNIV